jgi:hypothetical protein
VLCEEPRRERSNASAISSAVERFDAQQGGFLT